MTTRSTLSARLDALEPGKRLPLATTEDRFEHRPMEYVSVPTSTGKTIFVGMKDREEFDRIALPLVDGGPNERGHVLIKAAHADDVHVIFQYWVKSLTDAALMDGLRSKGAA
jgi:hypothetical protein